MVDESQVDVSGCFIDFFVYFLKKLQVEYGVDLFDCMYFSYQDGDVVYIVSWEEFVCWYVEG